MNGLIEWKNGEWSITEKGVEVYSSRGLRSLGMEGWELARFRGMCKSLI